MADMKTLGTLRVGKVNFINTLPIFYPLENGAVCHDFQIIDGAPAELNALLAAGKLDLGLVSSVEYARRFDEYLLLPGLSISSKTKVGSVLLLSRVALQELDGQEILLTPKSATSAALLKLLFARRFAMAPRYRVADYHAAGPRWPDGAAAIMAIGDDALQLRTSVEARLALDLAEAWHEWTGQPFVFAVWALRRETLARRDGLVQQALAALLAAKDYGLDHLDEIAATAGRRLWFSQRECQEYLQTIHYDFGADKQAGLGLFFDMLYEEGALSRRVSLNFLPQPTAPARDV